LQRRQVGHTVWRRAVRAGAEDHQVAGDQGEVQGVQCPRGAEERHRTDQVDHEKCGQDAGQKDGCGAVHPGAGRIR